MITSTPHAERDTLYFYSTPTPVPIFQREWEFRQLLDIYIARKPRRVLEIGTFHGGTLYHFLQNARPGTHVVSVDSYSENVDNRHLYSEWTPTGVECWPIQGDSRSQAVIHEVASFGPYDWIVIDAGHLALEVRADWQHYEPMCAPGGIVCLHDICPSPHDWLQVDQVWQEIRALGHLTQEIVCAYGLDWSGWGVVYR